MIFMTSFCGEMNELSSKLFKTFFRSEKSFKTKKLWSLKICMGRFFSKKYLEIWSMILFAKGLREVVSHPRIDTVLVLTGVCWHWPECHIFFAKSESSNEGYDRGNRNNPAQSSRILGIRIDNSVTMSWHRLNFRSFGLSIAVVSVFWFWVFLLIIYRWNISKYRWNKM